jgi:hypothetical protein
MSFASPALAALAQPPAPAPCGTPEYHQFDFWIGRWDVFRADTHRLVAHSLIEKLYGGCAIRENWMPLVGGGGGSLNAYRPKEHHWRQVWMDSMNNLNSYAGALEHGVMVMRGVSHAPSGSAASEKMTFEALPDGSVVQTGFRSAGKHASWTISYRFIYRRPANRSS